MTIVDKQIIFLIVGIGGSLLLSWFLIKIGFLTDN